MIFGILLAAGMSTRMGLPKQTLDWGGRPLVRHVAEQALASRLDGLIVVLGAEASVVRAALSGLSGPVQTVENLEYRVGQALSLRSGMMALPMVASAVVVLLVDQPFVSPGLIDTIIAAYNADREVAAVAPYYQGRRGNPVLLDRRLFGELIMLTGDMGARKLLDHHAAAVRRLDLADPAIVTDIDTWESYAHLRP